MGLFFHFCKNTPLNPSRLSKKNENSGRQGETHEEKS